VAPLHKEVLPITPPEQFLPSAITPDVSEVLPMHKAVLPIPSPETFGAPLDATGALTAEQFASNMMPGMTIGGLSGAAAKALPVGEGRTANVLKGVALGAGAGWTYGGPAGAIISSLIGGASGSK
jgi:hypothetical protein